MEHVIQLMLPIRPLQRMILYMKLTPAMTIMTWTSRMSMVRIFSVKIVHHHLCNEQCDNAQVLGILHKWIEQHVTECIVNYLNNPTVR